MEGKKKNRARRKVVKFGKNIREKLINSKHEDEQNILNEKDNLSQGCSIELLEEDGEIGQISKNDDPEKRCQDCGYIHSSESMVDNLECQMCDENQQHCVHISQKQQEGATQKKSKKKKSRKKKCKKAGYRVWRVCVTGWKYMKAGLVFYVNSPTNALNPLNLGTSNSQRYQRSNYNDPMYKKYSYIYKT